MERARCRDDSFEQIYRVVRRFLDDNHMSHSMVRVDPIAPVVGGAVCADICVATIECDFNVRVWLTIFDTDETFASRVASQLAPYCTPRFTPV